MTQAIHRRAFVLSGGGNLGASQAGALLALAERDIAPDLLVGTSAGAINAAFLAGRPTAGGAEELARIWTSTRSRDVFRLPLNPMRWIGRLRGSALYDNTGLRDLLEAHLDYDRIEDAPVGLRVVATDLRTGAERSFFRGPVVDAVLASAALPGLFPPVEVGGTVYVDGGISDNVPISPAVGYGADEIYVIHVGTSCVAEPRGALDVLLRSIGHLINRTLAADVRRFSKRSRIIVLPAPCVAPTPLWNLSGSAAMVEEARRAVGAFLDARADQAVPA